MGAERPIVVVGAGHAGVQAAAALREEGIEAPIALIGQERWLPYDRPPLSKRLLLGEVKPGDFLLRDSAFYSDRGITLHLGERVTALELSQSRIRLGSSAHIDYGHLILATGSTSRSLDVPGAELEGVATLRSLDEAVGLSERLRHARTLAVIGAGFIGMEVAAVAARLGCQVHIIELGHRPLARAVSPGTSEFFTRRYREKGIGFTFGRAIDRIVGQSGKAHLVKLAGGAVVEADLVLIAVGAKPCDELAARAGLQCGNGVHVDASMRTTQPGVLAIGDCALHPNRFAGRTLRLESVQNACDQARIAAKTVRGQPSQYTAVPWFWSDLGDWRLQIAGLMDRCDSHVLRGDPASGKYSIYGFRLGKLVGVESVNRPADHLLAKRLLAADVDVPSGAVADEGRDLRQLLHVAVKAGEA